MVDWRNVFEEGAEHTTGHAIYMASWIAPTADCHTQQSFHCICSKGELRADQAHRGYSQSADVSNGGTGAFATLNPLYMRYVPDAQGFFAGQLGYGYRSLETFVDLAAAVQSGDVTLNAAEDSGLIATAKTTLWTTAILEAGRRSLDLGGVPVHIEYSLIEGDASAKPSGFRV